MDVQIGHEKTLTGLMPVLAGVDLVYGLGMIDMGMAISYEQFLMDAEFVRMFKRTEKEVAVDADALALEVIEAVGPAGNYLSQKHTLRHMRDEISTTELIDRRMRESSEKDGATDMPQRARLWNVRKRNYADKYQRIFGRRKGTGPQADHGNPERNRRVGKERQSFSPA